MAKHALVTVHQVDDRRMAECACGNVVTEDWFENHLRAVKAAEAAMKADAPKAPSRGKSA